METGLANRRLLTGGVLHSRALRSGVFGDLGDARWSPSRQKSVLGPREHWMILSTLAFTCTPHSLVSALLIDGGRPGLTWDMMALHNSR